MSHKVETIVASSQMKSSADKIFDMYKNKVTDIARIFPASFKGIKVIEGELGRLGCVTLWSFAHGRGIQTLKLEVEEIDDAARSITFTVIEGYLLVIYKSFKLIVDVSEGFIKETFMYEKATLLSPAPYELVPIAVAKFNRIDAHLQLNA